jgi:preprotein translocase subunit SecG
MLAIHEFEQVCRDHGVVPQLYHSDNASVFTSEGMAEKLKRFTQIITFAGAGALIIITVRPSARLEPLPTWRAR